MLVVFGEVKMCEMGMGKWQLRISERQQQIANSGNKIFSLKVSATIIFR